MKRKPKIKLTEEQWKQVFRIRCRSKRGEEIHQEDQDLCVVAMAEDADRYESLNAEVFDATVPPGSTAKWKRK